MTRKIDVNINMGPYWTPLLLSHRKSRLLVQGRLHSYPVARAIDAYFEVCSYSLSVTQKMDVYSMAGFCIVAT